MKVLVDPALVGDVGEPGVEERQVRSRIDRKVHHAVLAGLDLAGVDRHRAPRVDEDDPAPADALRSAIARLLLVSSTCRADSESSG